MKRIKQSMGYSVLFILIIASIWYCRIPDINTCSITDLLNIQGIGEVRASLIISNRPYRNYDEIERLEKIGEKTVEKLKKNTKIFSK